MSMDDNQQHRLFLTKDSWYDYLLNNKDQLIVMILLQNRDSTLEILNSAVSW